MDEDQEALRVEVIAAAKDEDKIVVVDDVAEEEPEEDEKDDETPPKPDTSAKDDLIVAMGGAKTIEDLQAVYDVTGLSYEDQDVVSKIYDGFAKELK